MHLASSYLNPPYSENFEKMAKFQKRWSAAATVALQPLPNKKKASVQLRLYACLFINKMMNRRADEIYFARIELYF